MPSVASWLSGLFAFLGPAGTLLALFLVFVIDAAIVPALPELAVVLSFLLGDPGVGPVPWAILLLAMALAGELVGNNVMYLWVRKLVVDRGHLPKILEKAMQRWTHFLVVPDERVLLVNRIAPVLPFAGAFIAILHWRYARSFAYIAIGAVAKYSALLVLVGYLGVIYDPNTATLVTIAAVVVLVAASVIASILYRRRASVPPTSGH